MTIADATRLTAALADRYSLERELGAGGMATVYLAHDVKHDRKVAVKVLKPELAAVLGAERFVVEIKTTAALQHPHILPLFDSGEADGFLYYVMPFIDGETLRARLGRETQLGIDEAVRMTTAVADALHYAHRHGVVHRDVKPENILLHEGRPMVADFGIALAVSAAAGGRMTETGLSLGTPHYMSPEQATAEKEISARSDIYSLGSVLYEMLAGSPPHTGASAQQIIMKIVTEEAAPVAKLRKAVPPNVAAAVAKSLEKLPADRFESAKEFADALANASFAIAGRSTGALASTGGRHSWERWLRDPRTWAALGVVGALAATSLVARRAHPTRLVGPETVRFTVSGPSDTAVLSLSVQTARPIAAPVVSSDGRYVAFGVHRATGAGLALRALDSFELFEIPGGGSGPFFSPENSSVGFFRESEIWTMSIAERVPTRVGALPERPWDITSAVWHPDGRILINGARGLWALSARGGAPTLLVATDSAAHERFLDIGLFPDGRILLGIMAPAGSRTEVLSPSGTERARIFPGFDQVRLVDDILFFAQSGQARATRFDRQRLVPIGAPIALKEFPSQRLDRSVAWVEGLGVRDLEPVWVSRTGTVASLGMPGAVFRWPRVSPDGRRLVLAIERPQDQASLNVIDLARHTRTAVGGATEPVWSADGRSLFSSAGNRPFGGLLNQVADASLAPDTLLQLESGDAWPTSASRDGRWLAFYGATLGAGKGGDASDPNDLWFMELSTRQVRRIRLPGGQRGARFSPDGRWVAYESTESGREEVHVRPWPAMDANYLISIGGGTEPTWSPDGRELYYRRLDEVVSVGITVRGSSVERAPPRVLFSGVFYRDEMGDQSYDVGPDGRFLMMRPVSGSRVELRVALNWIADVRARLERGQ
jgi:eukaryotic-like serine/threonine-protein kinase